MERLSSPLGDMKAEYTVIVVGSGYGGAIAASRMARAGQQVCVLERGREIHPSDYPNLKHHAVKNMQIDTPLGRAGSPLGLYDFRINEDVNVFVGCGLGGTSLVNANVSLRADPRVFEDARWPEEISADAHTILQDAYTRAEEMLEPSPYPASRSVRKLDALEASGREFPEASFYRPPLNVTFEARTNFAGVRQWACSDCGDCVSGCNEGAKNTTLMNYLPDAKRHGAEIFTETKVTRVERQGKKWLVFFEAVGTGEDLFQSPERFISADIVILGCGALGSTEILLRSRENGLPVSKNLGFHFNGNGDVLGFGYNTDRRIHGVGFGRRKDLEPVGPCITGIIDFRSGREQMKEGFVIEEGSLPGALAQLSARVMPLIACFWGREVKRTWGEYFRQCLRAVKGFFGGPYTGAIANTQTYLVMSHDDDAGEMHLEHDRIRIRWPGVGRQRNFQQVDSALFRATRPLGGLYVKNPIWSAEFKWDLVTVHPLGGCPMAASAETGVVNHKGEVFSGSAGKDVHAGLHVCDGAVVPVTLGVNPLLTISALAERTCHYLAQDRGWTIDYARREASTGPRRVKTPGLQFTERMAGFFQPGATATLREPAQEGSEENRSELSVTLVLRAEDLDSFLSEPSHPMKVSGTAAASALSAWPLTVVEGEAEILTRDPSIPETLSMVYRLKLCTRDGTCYHLDGLKTLSPGPLSRAWHESTTLAFTLRQTEGAAAIGGGILNIGGRDLLRQLRTFQVPNARSTIEMLTSLGRFARFFAGSMWQTYGGMFLRPQRVAGLERPRPGRPLRAPAPETHDFQAEDGVPLRLTRYHGGQKGPVIVAHGLGVSSEIFATDLIETNLVEFLCERGFDVWLLDLRFSITLDAVRQAWSGDDAAKSDYPAAVRRVRELTGAASVQMVAHCWGAGAMFLSLLDGHLQDVRSIVSSQIGVDYVPSLGVGIKTGLHFPDLLAAAGIAILNARARAEAPWPELIYDRVLSVLALLSARGRCRSATCHRINFMYAALYEHGRLNDAVHAGLHELFGYASLRAFQHLGRICRKGRIVRADGSEPLSEAGWSRLDLPIAFIHGAENRCFRPAGTERTWRELSRRFGPEAYSRTVVPGYGHIDCIFGKDSARDVFPHIAAHLEKTAEETSTTHQP